MTIPVLSFCQQDGWSARYTAPFMEVVPPPKKAHLENSAKQEMALWKKEQSLVDVADFYIFGGRSKWW